MKTIINRGQLESRLKDKGYKLISKTKQGRKVIYNIEKENNDKEVYSNICQYLFNTKHDEQFADYFISRMINLELPITKEMISKKSNVHRNTITKWDKKMIENNILAKDGYFYVAVDYNKDVEGNKVPFYRLTSKEEYISYMQTSKHARKSSEIKAKYISGKIDLDEYTMLLQNITISQAELERKFIYRVSKFNLKKNNKLYKDVFKLIKNLYINKRFIDYYESWLLNN